MLEEKVKVFVYGTLMENFRNYNKFLKPFVYHIQKASTKGTLYHLKNKDCPALVEGEETVFGEVISFVDDKNHSVLKKLDNLEEYFEDSTELMYERKLVEVKCENDGTERVYVYMFINTKLLTDENSEKVLGGDWRAYKEVI